MPIGKLFCVIFVFGLVTLSVAKTEPNFDESNSINAEALSRNTIVKDDHDREVTLTPKEYLLYFTLMSFRDISQEYVDHAANISDHLLKDDVLASSSGSVIKAFKKNITEFLDKYNNYKELDELFNLVDLYSNTTSHYFELKSRTATPDMKIIEEKLKQYGSHDLDKQFENEFLVFVGKFYVQFDEFKSKLTKEELENEKHMIQWLDEFKPISNAEEKIMAFEKFFEFFEE